MASSAKLEHTWARHWIRKVACGRASNPTKDTHGTGETASDRPPITKHYGSAGRDNSKSGFFLFAQVPLLNPAGKAISLVIEAILQVYLNVICDTGRVLSLAGK
jgi:hypothetical protein